MSANGQLEASELTPVGNGMYLATATATAWRRMYAAAKASTGVAMRITPPNGAYRDLKAQQYMIDHPTGPVRIADLGHSSHGDGRAVDISNFTLVYDWLRNHADEYGFTQQFASEQWHWRHDGTTLAGGGAEIAPERRKTMTTNYVNTDTYKSGKAAKGTICATAGDSPGTSANWLEYPRTMLENERAALMTSAHGPHVELTAAEFADYRNRYLSPLITASGSSGSSGPTAAEIAKAVNDDAAARLQS